MFRVNGQPAIGLAVAMRDGGDILALGQQHPRRDGRHHAPTCRSASSPSLVADQAVTVDTAIGDFTESLWQAILIIMVVSFLALGVRAGAVVALSIPLTLAIVFPLMMLAGIDLQRISLGALIIALTLLVDDAMTTIDAMIRRLAAGDTQGAGGDLRLPHAGGADADRHAGHHRGLRADRLRGKPRPANTPSRSSRWSASR